MRHCFVFYSWRYTEGLLLPNWFLIQAYRTCCETHTSQLVVMSDLQDMQGVDDVGAYATSTALVLED